MQQTSTAKERVGELARKRYQLEQQAENQMDALLSTLGEIRELDVEQRRLGREGGVYEPNREIRPLLSDVLRVWLANKLGGRSGYAPLVRKHNFKGEPLQQTDPLAQKP